LNEQLFRFGTAFKVIFDWYGRTGRIPCFAAANPTMKIRDLSSSIAPLLASSWIVCVSAPAQVVDASQSVSLKEMRTSASHGSFPSAAFAAEGNLFLLLDEQDGIRVVKTDLTGKSVLADAHIGVKGDSPVAMTLDSSGDIYVVGTTDSGSLIGTPGIAFPAAADRSTNSFLAKYDANLNLIFVTFLGAGRTSATGVAATSDAVFVTGFTFNTAFPVSAMGIQQSPAKGSSKNGFVERFSVDGSTLLYATYLSGDDGDTVPTAIAADDLDNAYVTGSTSSASYPTTAALQNSILLAVATTSGFLTKIGPTGSAFAFSTYIAGVGITSLALDAATCSLLLIGNIAVGQFPIATVTMPLTASSQTMLRIPCDGQSVNASIVLVPRSQSHAEMNSPYSSPFRVTDRCASILESHSLCRTELRYLSSTAPSWDAKTLILDGKKVLLSSATLPVGKPTGEALNPALSLSATALTFTPPVIVTQVAGVLQLLTVTNTGGSSLSLTFAVSGDFTLVNDCPGSLAPADSCLVQIGFTPSQPGERDGVLSVTTGGGFTPSDVSLSGTGLPILPANNGTLDLGQTLLGEPVVAWYKVQQPIVSLTATTNSAVVGLALVADTGSGHGSLPASGFAQTVTANCNNCWLGVQFFPQIAGPESASLAITSNAGGNPYSLTLKAIALPEQGLVLTPISQDFGTIAVNSSSAPMTFTLTNLLTNAAAVTVQTVTVSGDFTLMANANGGVACSGTVDSTASCFVQVSFAPTATGERQGLLTIVTSSGTVTAVLTGSASADPGLAINPTSLSFSNVPGATATQQSILLSNTGSSSLSIGSPNASDPSFNVSSGCATLAAGASCSVIVVFTPQSATVAATLSIPVTSTLNGQTATNNYAVALLGAYTTQDSGLEIVAGDVNYGSTPTGALGSTREFTLNNLTAKALSVTFALPRQFPLASLESCATLSADQSCSFSVSFLPVTGGPLTGTVVAQGTPSDGSAGVQALAYMLGYGVATGSLAIGGNAIPNTPIGFGQVTSGQSAQQVLTLTNNGTGSLTIRRITSEPPFLSTSSCGTALAPNASCSVTLTYAPIYEALANAGATPRNDTGTLVVESDAVSSPDMLGLSGIAVPVVSSNPTSSAVLSALQVSQGSLTFGNTQVGNVSAAQVVTLTNMGTTTVDIQTAVASTDFVSTGTCATLLPGAACSLSVTFTPTTASASSVRSGTVEILSDASTSLEFISLMGVSTPSALTLNPAALDFGTVDVGSHGTLSVTVTDTAAIPVTFLGLATSGDYSVDAGTCPANGSTLAAGSSCVLTVRFTPSGTGTRTGTLSLSNDASQLPLTVSLTGNAVAAQLTVTPGALAFGSIDVGFPAMLTLTLLNTGSASVTGIGNVVSGVNAGDFAVTAPCSAKSLAPNQGCTETVTFTPIANGARSATLTIASSDPKGPAVIALTGRGVNAGTFVLTVNGSSAATMTVASGSPGTYALLLTPMNSFSGEVALTCAPISAGEYTSCSLLASTLTLGSSALSSTATINTITSDIGVGIVAFSGLLLVPFARTRRLRKKRLFIGFFAVFICFGLMAGCWGGGSPSVSAVRTTPAGTYQYRVTASATAGAAVSSSVVLTLIVK
jgi:trimeric autotransporter adhesin